MLPSLPRGRWESLTSRQQLGGTVAATPTRQRPFSCRDFKLAALLVKTTILPQMEGAESVEKNLQIFCEMEGCIASERSLID